MVVRLRHVSRSTGSAIVLSTSPLTSSERRSLGDLQLSWWTLPDPAQEVEAILAQSFGGGGPRLLAAFCRSYGLRRGGPTTDYKPAVLAFLQKAFFRRSRLRRGGAGRGLQTPPPAAARAPR